MALGRSLSLAAYLALARRGPKQAAAFPAARPEGTLLWGHATSPARATALLQIAVRLRQQRPDLNLLLTAPPEMERPEHLRGRRDLTVASAPGGGYLVGTQNISFIEMLRNRSVAYRMGAMRLGGLQGNVTVPKQTGAATWYWLASESTNITESQQTLGQMALSPKTGGAYTEISRQLLLQSSPDAEVLVTSDLGRVGGLGIDSAVLAGSGALPVIVAQRALERGDSTLDAARPIAVIVLIVASAMLGLLLSAVAKSNEQIMPLLEDVFIDLSGSSAKADAEDNRGIK